jgi:hypothetical protein
MSLGMLRKLRNKEKLRKMNAGKTTSFETTESSCTISKDCFHSSGNKIPLKQLSYSEYLRKKTTKGTTNAYGYNYNHCNGGCDKDVNTTVYRNLNTSQHDYVLNKRLVEIVKAGDISCNGFAETKSAILNNGCCNNKDLHKTFIHKTFNEKYRAASDIVTKKMAMRKFKCGDTVNSTMDHFEHANVLPVDNSCS